MLAMILSQFIGIICGYLLHKNITFSSSASGKEGFFEFLRFTAVNILTFFLNLVQSLRLKESANPFNSLALPSVKSSNADRIER